jgi:hypothetical protein
MGFFANYEPVSELPTIRVSIGSVNTRAFRWTNPEPLVLDCP